MEDTYHSDRTSNEIIQSHNRLLNNIFDGGCTCLWLIQISHLFDMTNRLQIKGREFLLKIRKENFGSKPDRITALALQKRLNTGLLTQMAIFDRRNPLHKIQLSMYRPQVQNLNILRCRGETFLSAHKYFSSISSHFLRAQNCECHYDKLAFQMSRIVPCEQTFSSINSYFVLLLASKRISWTMVLSGQMVKRIFKRARWSEQWEEKNNNNNKIYASLKQHTNISIYTIKILLL